MRREVHPQTATEVPTVTDGVPPDPDVQARVVSNQVRAARDWNETAQDLVINNIVNENQEVRESRQQVLVLALVVLVLLVVGSVYAYRTYSHDRFVEQQRTEATNTPYRPETIR